MTSGDEQLILGFPGGASGKESTCNAGDAKDTDLIPGMGRFPGERNGNPVQYPCLESPGTEKPGRL